jgi:hypothetical protein
MVDRLIGKRGRRGSETNALFCCVDVYTIG